MTPYGTVMIYWVTDPQKIRNMFNDADWNGKAAAFEKGWISQNRVDVRAGTRITLTEEGKIVNSITKEYD
ncbi:hypothetical protein ANO14919_075360 [Xylariales sp. No.14919]|nr:hypothetical protein ANO14919_075360 [Xylariales sp. No.14919]